MQEYPEEEVDRIIGEEIMRAEGTRKWYGPVARTRIHTLLMSRLCAAWSVPAVRAAIEAVAAAEAKILYLGATKECVFDFIDNAYHELMERLVACEHALGLTLAAYAAWPDPCAVCGAEKMRAGIEAVRELRSIQREELQETHRRGKRVQMPNSAFIKIQEELSLGYAAFLTPQEEARLYPQFERALARIVEHHELFFATSGPTPRA